MHLKTPEQLHDLASAVLAAAGASQESADIVAEHLVSANLSGVDTHGVRHIPGYVRDIAAGFIEGKAQPTTLRSGPSSLLVSGNWTFGQVAARYATELGIERALDSGVFAVGLVQCHHIGRLGYYTELAAEKGLVAQVWAGGYSEEAPTTVPFGGRQRLLNTNPISMAFPSGSGHPMMFDFATTSLSGVKIEDARRHGEALPAGAIVDRNGKFSTDPNDFFAGGAHHPFGGHKGYAFNMAAEYYGRVLTGSNAYADPKRGGPIMRNQGVTIILMRDDLFTSSAEFEQRADEMGSRTRAVAPAAGFRSVLVPGDPEWNTRQKRQVEGIPIEDTIWEELESLPRGSGG
jgi:LDH2 family malate/lactate/ureidoglycolate dehydrogenase